MIGLNRIVNFKGKRFIVGSRATAEARVSDYLRKRAAGESIPVNEMIAGVLSVGDCGLDAIEQTYGPVDFVHVNLAGKTDLTIDPALKKGAKAERLPRSRCETPQTINGRKATAVQALMAAQVAFMNRPKGIFVIHCEHGLHRAPAYFYGVASDMIAAQVTLTHFDKPEAAEKTLTLNKNRHIKASRSALWATLGERLEGSADDPDAYWPYPRIMNCFDDVISEMYKELTPQTKRQQRDAQVAENTRRLLAHQNGGPC